MVNCCYVAVCSAAQGASAPIGEERGGGISWRPPTYSLLNIRFVCDSSSVSVGFVFGSALFFIDGIVKMFRWLSSVTD